MTSPTFIPRRRYGALNWSRAEWREWLARWLTSASYLVMALWMAPQWLHLLRHPEMAGGVAVAGLLALCGALAGLQAAFWLGRVRWPIQLGNAAGLANALITLGVWLWATGGQV